MKIFNFIFKLFKITLSVEENLIKEIITLMCLNDTTVILYSPIEDIYLLKNKKLDYYVEIISNSIKISNHKFQISRQIPLQIISIFTAIITDRITKNKNAIEEEIFINETVLLSKIISNLKP